MNLRKTLEIWIRKPNDKFSNVIGQDINFLKMKYTMFIDFGMNQKMRTEIALGDWLLNSIERLKPKNYILTTISEEKIQFYKEATNENP